MVSSPTPVAALRGHWLGYCSIHATHETDNTFQPNKQASIRARRNDLLEGVLLHDAQ
jgi:hypothetical protein